MEQKTITVWLIVRRNYKDDSEDVLSMHYSRFEAQRALKWHIAYAVRDGDEVEGHTQYEDPDVSFYIHPVDNFKFDYRNLQ